MANEELERKGHICECVAAGVLLLALLAFSLSGCKRPHPCGWGSQDEMRKEAYDSREER